MKASVSTILLILFFSVNAFAQQEESVPSNYLGIGVGYRFDNIKDTNFSPLNQKGNSFFYSLFYERYSKNILKINVKYSDDILKSGPKNRLETSYYSASIGISYLKKITPNQQATNLYIGASYKLDILYMDWYDQDAFSYVSANGLAINAAISKQLTPRAFIESTVSIPVIQFLSRPPYNGLDTYIIENQDKPLNIIFNGKLSSFKQYKSINWNVNYRHELSNRFNWKVDYDFNFQKIEKEPTFTGLSNKISTSILYKF